VALLALPPHRLSAQAAVPEIVLSASGGRTFSRPLWILRQLVVVPVPGPLLLDTFLLARGLAPGWSAWAGLTWYPRGNAGLGAEVGWVAAQARSDCVIVGVPHLDSYQQNAVVCAGIAQDRWLRTSAIALLGTATLRAAPRRDVSPFVKAGVGLAVLGFSFADARAWAPGPTCANCERIILEGDPRLVTWAAALAAGLSFGGVSSHRLRVEVRDFVLGIPVVTGPADPLAEHPVPPTRTRAIHRVTIALGLDIVLSGRHRRRY
jgi:hypothetical protein